MDDPCPEEFVLTLRDDIGVGGVVAGRNYRFGFKAAGTATTLVELGEKHGVEVDIVDLLQADEEENCKDGGEGDDGEVCTPQVSSTRVRACLAAGDVEQAGRLLGRRHRLVLLRRRGDDQDEESAGAGAGAGAGEGDKTAAKGAAVFPLTAALNQYPAPGKYAGVVSVSESEGIERDGGEVVGGGAGGGGGGGAGVAVTVVVGDSDIRLEAEAGGEEEVEDLHRVVDRAARVCVDITARCTP